MSEFHFLRPEWFWALLPLALLLLWASLRKLYKGNWSRVVDLQLQAHVLVQHQHQGGHQRLWLPALAGILAIIAMAGPTWKQLPLPVFKEEATLVVALDLSASMNAADVKPSRLQRARLKLIDILRAHRDRQTALIVFAGDAYVVTPLTDDIETIITHVPNLTSDLMPSQGSRADLAVDKALELLQQTAVQHADVLLITDGADAGQLQAAADRIQRHGHRLLILGVGTAEGAPIPAPDSGFLKNRIGAIVIAKLDETPLQQAGLYHRMTLNDGDINYLFKQHINEMLAAQHKETKLNSDTWRDEGPWLLLPLLLLVPLAFRRGLLLLAALCLLPLPQPAQAFNWQDLWRNDNQRAAVKLEQGDAKAAAEQFDDPAWRAAAEYRAGDYDKAVEQLQTLDDTDSLYNKGNALAKLGRIAEAIASYDAVLERDPQHEDARHNREVLQRIQKQQQQQDSDQQQSSDQQNAEQQQSPQQQNPQQASEQQPASQQDSQQSQQNASQQQQGEQSNPQQQPPQQANDDAKQQQANEQQAAAAKAADKKAAEQQQAEQEGEPDQQRPDKAVAASNDQQEPDPQQQAIEQWLRRVPDDPGGLLRRKFLYQYRQQNQGNQESEPW